VQRRITKVKYDGERVAIAYDEVKLGGAADHYTLDCDDAPAPGFTRALQKLAKHILELCELAEEYGQGLTVRGVSFSYSGEHGVMGAVVTALKTLQMVSSPLVLNTPHQTEAPVSDSGDPSVCMTSAFAKDLQAVQVQAERYIDGKRAQVSLFEDVPPASADPSGLKDLAEADASASEART
jgi:hypothetical protein